MNYLSNPRVRLFVGAGLVSLSPVWVKLVNVPPTTSGFYRAIIGGCALVIFLVATGRRLNFSKRVWLILSLSSILFALDLWFWHRSINYIGPGLSTLLANFQVFFMMLAGLCLLGEKPRPIQIIAVPLALLGLALIVGLDWQSLPENYRLGVVFGLLTAVVYAGYLLTMREARTHTVYRLPAREVAVISIGSAALLAISAMVEGQSLSIPTYADAAWLIAYGILSNCLGLLFIASSLPQVSAAEAGLALLLQPTLSFVWDVVFFARPLTAVELTGAVITLIAIYLGSRPASKQVQGAGQ